MVTETKCTNFGGPPRSSGRAPIKRELSQSGAIHCKLPRYKASGVYPERSLGRLSATIPARPVRRAWPSSQCVLEIIYIFSVSSKL
jgi:hypothetical protein